MKGRGHAKVILLGEHAVVYGRPALAAALPLGAEATATASTRDRLRVPAWGVDLALDATERDELGTAFEALLSTYGARRAPVEVRLDVDIPSGAGLGGSAASGVAIADAVGRCFGVEEGRAGLAERALAWERVFHGDASGLDPELAARGGVLRFLRQGPRAQVPTAASICVVIADSGARARTRVMVEGVAARRAAAARETEALFDAIAALVDEGCDALRAGDPVTLGRALTENHALLARLGVSTPALDALGDAALAAGALGAKLTGSGGGGCLLALAADGRAARRIAGALEGHGARTWRLEVAS